MRLDAIQFITRQLPEYMERLKIPHRYRTKLYHGKVSEVEGGDIEIVVGELANDCQYKLVFDLTGSFKKAFHVESNDLNGQSVLFYKPINIPLIKRLNLIKKLFGLAK